MSPWSKTLLPVALFLSLSSGITFAGEPEAVMVETYEQDAWVSAKDINTQESYEAYLVDYANGRHAKYAIAAINKLKQASQQPPTEAVEKSGHKEGGAENHLAPPAQAQQQPAAVAAPTNQSTADATPAVTAIKEATVSAVTVPVAKEAAVPSSTVSVASQK